MASIFCTCTFQPDDIASTSYAAVVILAMTAMYYTCSCFNFVVATDSASRTKGAQNVVPHVAPPIAQPVAQPVVQPDAQPPCLKPAVILGMQPADSEATATQPNGMSSQVVSVSASDKFVAFGAFLREMFSKAEVLDAQIKSLHGLVLDVRKGNTPAVTVRTRLFNLCHPKGCLTKSGRILNLVLLQVFPILRRKVALKHLSRDQLCAELASVLVK